MRRHWEENHRVHQLNALCPIFDRMENIYCAMQLCKCCTARHPLEHRDWPGAKFPGHGIERQFARASLMKTDEDLGDFTPLHRPPLFNAAVLRLLDRVGTEP